MRKQPTLESLRSEAHVWLTGPADSASLSDCLELLAPEELEQYERFKVARARRLYLAARALARSALSSYLPEVAPAEWRFKFNRHGRPEIDARAGWPPLRFNLSHTDGLVACLIAWELDAGVDVENIERRINLVGVARHSFSKLEADDVERCRGRRRRERFFYYWTLKEAYIKARGMGLALPLRRFWYAFPEPGSVAIRFEPQVGDRDTDWQLALYRASSEHYLAAALRRGDAPDRKVVLIRSTPLAGGAREISLDLLAASAPAAEPAARTV